MNIENFTINDDDNEDDNDDEDYPDCGQNIRILNTVILVRSKMVHRGKWFTWHKRFSSIH